MCAGKTLVVRDLIRTRSVLLGDAERPNVSFKRGDTLQLFAKSDGQTFRVLKKNGTEPHYSLKWWFPIEALKPHKLGYAAADSPLPAKGWCGDWRS